MFGHGLSGEPLAYGLDFSFELDIGGEISKVVFKWFGERYEQMVVCYSLVVFM